MSTPVALAVGGGLILSCVCLLKTGLYPSVKGVLIPALALGGDGSHIFLLEFLCSTAKTQVELTIVGTKATDHEHDLKGLANGVTIGRKLLEQFSEVLFIEIWGG